MAKVQAKNYLQHSYDPDDLRRWLPKLRDNGFVFEPVFEAFGGPRNGVLLRIRHKGSGCEFKDLEEAYKWLSSWLDDTTIFPAS